MDKRLALIGCLVLGSSNVVILESAVSGEPANSGTELAPPFVLGDDETAAPGDDPMFDVCRTVLRDMYPSVQSEVLAFSRSPTWGFVVRARLQGERSTPDESIVCWTNDGVTAWLSTLLELKD